MKIRKEDSFCVFVIIVVILFSMPFYQRPSADYYAVSKSRKYIENTFNKCFYSHMFQNSSKRYDFFKSQSFCNKTNASECVEYQNKLVFLNGNNSIHDLNRCKRFITLHNYLGNTGNQMFEIASLLGIAFKYDFVPIVPKGTILKEYFDMPNIVAKNAIKLFKHRKYVCSPPTKLCDVSTWMNIENENVSLFGYFQSWKYFDNISFIIRRFYNFKMGHLENAKNYLSSVSMNNHSLVCFHIRRGAYTGNYRRSLGYVEPDSTFFEKAKQFYLSKYGQVQFIAVSKDKQWCAKNLDNVNISYLTDPGDDLALLSMCDHVVVTLGTFGWWGAWLSGGTTVYYDGFPRKDSFLASGFNQEDYYPPHWIGLS